MALAIVGINEPRCLGIDEFDDGGFVVDIGYRNGPAPYLGSEPGDGSKVLDGVRVLGRKALPINSDLKFKQLEVAY